MTHIRKSGIVIIALALGLGGCGQSKTDQAAGTPPATADAPLQIDRVEPSSTAMGVGFNARPDGQSALAVFGKDIPKGTVLLWNDQPLDTVVGGSFVAATVPAKLYEAAGSVAIKLKAANGITSDPKDFTIYGKTGPEPSVTQLYPGTTAPGKGFNVQPGGQSAIGVAGDNFLPGVSLMWDGKKLTTVFGKGTGLSAVVPPALIAGSGAHKVWAVNPDGKASNKVDFTIAN